jgi:hypothetical protein
MMNICWKVSIQYFLQYMKFLATFNYEVFACSIKTLTYPFPSFVAAFRKPLKTHKINPNAAVILKLF